MHYHLQNLAKYPLSIRFNSGRTLMLSPAEISAEIEEFEIQNNPKVERLTRQGLLEVTQPTQKPAGPKQKSDKRKKSK